MGKNKEEFMKDREKDFQTNGLDNDSLDDFHCLIDNVNDKMINLEEDLSNNELRVSELIGELEETKHLLSKCKTLISDMVMYNLDKDMYNRYDDVMKQAQELLTELKEY